MGDPVHHRHATAAQLGLDAIALDDVAWLEVLGHGGMLPELGCAMTGRFSLLTALLGLLFVAIALTAVGIGSSAYLATRQTVDLLWDDLSGQIAEHAEERTLRHFESGHAALELNERLAQIGTVDPSESEAMLRYLHAGLGANPNITWYTLARVDGAYLSAYRELDGGVRVTWREQVEGGALYRDFRVQEGSWVALPEEVKAYDPRTRPWFEPGLAATAPEATAPFLFSSRNQPGLMLVRSHVGPDGAAAGVWAAEYELSSLSSFLDDLAVVDNGRAYLVSGAGTVLAHPDGWTSADGKVAPADTHRDPLLRTAWNLASERGEHFAFDHEGTIYLTVVHRFEHAGLDWVLAVVLPEDDLIGQVRRNNQLAAGWAVFVAVMAMLIGAAFAHWLVSRPLAAIAQDLDRMGRLEFEAGETHSAFMREVATMRSARDRMRAGLVSFSRYVPHQLVRDLVEGQSEAELGGQERELTVFFSDIADFTTIAERMEPGALLDALGEYLEEMSAVVARRGGTVDKYIGDAIMAFWGAPRTMEDHALQAARAALEYQHRLEQLRQRWVAEGAPEFRARIGINTGRLLVGNMGSSYRMNYTVIGDAVNIASRLEGMCKPYGISIALGERTYELVRQHVVARPIDQVVVKGREQGLRVYELVGLVGEVDDATLSLCAAYTAAFDKYVDMDFEGASDLFERVLRTHPNDQPSRLMHERCEHLAAEPPGEGWTGSYRLTQK
jgi:adenylate cyclase